MGKTSFALGIAQHAAVHARVPVLVFSLEMSHLELTQRLLCSEAHVDATRMRNGRLLESDWPKISDAIGRLGDAPIYIDDNPNLTVMEIRAKARRLKAREGLGLVVVDYLQLMSGHARAGPRTARSRCRRSVVGSRCWPESSTSPWWRCRSCHETWRCARTSGPCSPTSASRDRSSRTPTWCSSSTATRSTTPTPPTAGTAEIIIAKHRNGPTGVTQLAFVDRFTRFAGIARV